MNQKANYPALEITQSNFIHQFDVVRPKYLKTNSWFYSTIQLTSVIDDAI